jgi:UDP-N-acetylmuramate dehydrogenase
MGGIKTVNSLKMVSEKYGGVYEENRRLGSYSTIRIGGPAKVFYVPSGEVALAEALKILKASGERHFFSGNGSNVLFSDDGFNGSVIKLNKNLFPPRRQGKEVTVSSGLKLSELLKMCMQTGLSGLECMAGIPATVGGALKNNASSGWGGITDVLERMCVLTEDGERIWVERGESEISYRSFSWPGGGVILEAVFALTESSPSQVKNRVKAFFSEKSKRQPCDKKTLGCVFKNPGTGGKTAWELIFMAGMKGKRSGGAMVSEQHANFIVNESGATSADVLSLIGDIKAKVSETSGVELEEEIEIVPFCPPKGAAE